METKYYMDKAERILDLVEEDYNNESTAMKGIGFAILALANAIEEDSWRKNNGQK